VVRRYLLARSALKSLEKPEGEPSEVFDFYLGALEEILGSMLDKNDPAKRGHHEKDQPEHQTKIAHPPTVRVSGFHRKRVKLRGHPKTRASGFSEEGRTQPPAPSSTAISIATKGMLFRRRDTTLTP
jgi:hypothetical protein